MNKPSDEQLVAYLDDELDPAYRSQLDSAIADDPLLSLRVQWFERSSLPYKDAYDELAQQAPLERLQARTGQKDGSAVGVTLLRPPR